METRLKKFWGSSFSSFRGLRVLGLRFRSVERVDFLICDDDDNNNNNRIKGTLCSEWLSISCQTLLPKDCDGVVASSAWLLFQHFFLQNQAHTVNMKLRIKTISNI